MLDTPQSRRRLLRTVSLAAGGLLTALAGLPVVGALFSPLLDRRQGKEGFLFALKLSDLEVGVPRRVDLTSTVTDGWTRSEGVVGAAWLLKDAAGAVRALSTVCPHSGCSIHFGEKGTFRCPCHASDFALDGRPMTGPSPRPMDPLEVEVKEEQVRVRYARFKQGTARREEI